MEEKKISNMNNVVTRQLSRMPTIKEVDGYESVKRALLKAVPHVILKRRLNFITIHYLYITGLTILSSVIFFGLGNVDYIDALLLSAGGCTQSGLNSIDINLLNTGQQVVVYLAAMLCNPITIHTSVVFIRLYWFERRFKDVVKEARALRRTKSKGRTNTFSKDDPEDGRDDRGIRGRAIQLLRSTGHRAEGRPISDNETGGTNGNIGNSSNPSGTDSQDDPPRRFSLRKRPSTNSMDDIRLPQQMNAEQHIKFLENQRNPKDDTTLRIPSPREFDRGGRVQSIDRSDEDLTRMPTKHQGQEEVPDAPKSTHISQHITFNEPAVTRNRTHTGREKHVPPRVGADQTPTVEQNAYFDDEQASRSGSRPPRPGPVGIKRTNTAKTIDTPYLSWQPTVARNSFFVNLTEEQREELGGIEYRALKTLALILLGYFFFLHIFGIVCLLPWIYHTSYGSIVTGDGQGRAWWGIFTPASMFNDLGFTLTPDSMVSFQTATFPLFIGTFLIILGNTGFPCGLRFTIWVLSKCTTQGSGLWEELHFLLDHPRRCFTLLFPRAATWWLFAILVILNGVDLIFFVILDLNDETVLALAPWYRFLDGLFQAASTRTAGFAVVNLANLHPAIQGM